MAVSRGFYKKIQSWVTAGDKKMGFRPFQVDGNPYKSSIFLVGAHAVPKIENHTTDENVFIESLVNGALFEEMYGYALKQKSRDYLGSIHFLQWLQEELKETAIMTAINPLQVHNVQAFKKIRQEAPELCDRGQTIFQEIMEEFQPTYVILHGTEAVQQFRNLFAAQITDRYGHLHKVQELEEIGVFAQLQCKSGKIVNILACRSMSYYGKEGKAFQAFKNKLQKILQAEKK